MTRPKANVLTSLSVFPKKQGRSDLVTRSGRAHSAETQNKESCLTLMRASAAGSTPADGVDASKSAEKREEIEKDAMRRLNERLVKMAGLEPKISRQRCCTPITPIGVGTGLVGRARTACNRCYHRFPHFPGASSETLSVIPFNVQCQRCI